jgi:acetyl esterase/lipase
MISALNQQLVAASYASWSREGADLTEMRSGYDTMCPPPATPVESKIDIFGGVAGQLVIPPERRSGIILFLHGGGFVMGSSRSHFSMVAELASAAQRPAALVDYRLAPEALFPAAIEDACAAYRGLLTAGHAAEQIALVGDSAGGGLAFSALFALRDEGTPLPGCLVTMSAWTDLTCSGASLQAKADVDPILTPDVPRQYASLYLGAHDSRDPLASPIFGDFTGLPPTLMQVGSDEILLDDTIRVAEAAQRAGCDVSLEVADGMMHVYQMLTWLTPNARTALRSAASFIDRHLGQEAR